MKKMVMKLTALICSLVLVFSILGTATLNPTPEKENIIALLELDALERLPSQFVSQIKVLETYDHHALVSIDTRLVNDIISMGEEIDTLPQRTHIYTRRGRFDIMEEPSYIPEHLKISEYEEETKGLYIVHMLGPISYNWRRLLEDHDLEILNYMPNHAYRVRMTPETALMVEKLYFVDWVGIYHPYYKLPSQIEPGLFDIRITEDNFMNSLTEIRNIAETLSFTEIDKGVFLLTAEVDSKQSLYSLAKMNTVDQIIPNIPIELHDEIATQHIGGGSYFFDDQDDDPDTAYRSHGEYGSYMNQLGYTGDNVVTAVADTGLGDGSVGDAGHPDFTGRVIGGYSYQGGWEDGHGHGTHCAGSLGGNSHDGTGDKFYEDYYSAVGSAPETDFFAVRIFSSAGGYIGPNDIYHIVQIAKQEGGAYVHSNSWGAAVGGAYDHRSEAFDRAVRDADPDSNGNEPMIITTSAGNSGPDDMTIGTPATGKNVITVGASLRYPNNPENVASFSSRGWTQDNRVKPDLQAPGASIYSMTPDGGYQYMSGTSMSNPAVAGAAAVVVEWFELNHGYRPSPAMVKALLINTANPLDGNTRGSIPNQDEGWGMVDISKLHRPLEDPVSFYLEDQNHIFTDSLQTNEHMIVSERDGEPLKISLVWTDKEGPGDTGDGRALINDLNLEVESPSGKIYRGNGFIDGWTPSGEYAMSDFDRNGDGWDDTNNVENVYIHPDDVETGIYTVTVEAREVADDALNLGYNSQDYALVAFNAVDDIDGMSPKVSLESPNGGETFDALQTEYIYWETEEGDDPIDRIDLFLSTDGGSYWRSIERGLQDTGDHHWNIPNVHSDECMVKVRVVDTFGRSYEDESDEVFKIIGSPPEPPKNLSVDHFGQKLEVLFHDDMSELKEGYITGESHDQASRWAVREHGAFSGSNSWDWGDGEFNKDASGGMLSWLITPDINIPDESDKEHGVSLSFNYWRDFGDNGMYDAGNVKISIDGVDGPWTLVSPTNGYHGTVPDAFDNPLGGQEAYGGSGDWTEASFDLTEYIGETVNIRWDAGTEAWDGMEGAGWRIDDIYVEALVPDPYCTNCNLISWDAAEDEGSSIKKYNIYRSEGSTGPWDETTIIDTIQSDGSESYEYIDVGKGTGDDICWWYLVRSVGKNSIEEQNDDAVQEQNEQEKITEIMLEVIEDADGWNFISLGLLPHEDCLITILEHPDYGIAGSFDRLMYYYAVEDRWYSYVPGRADHFNNVDSWDHTIAVWIRMTSNDILSVEGIEPVETIINLDPGWNMVGVPLSWDADLELPLEVDLIAHFDANKDNNIGYIEDIDILEFVAGEGYWLYNGADHHVEWTIEL